MPLEDFQIAIQEQFPEADFTKGKFGFSKNDPRYDKARTIFRRITGQFKAYDEKRKTDPKRLEYRAAYKPTAESIAKRKAKQKLEYDKDPEKFLARNRKYLTRPDIQAARRDYMKKRYYEGGQRAKDLARLTGRIIDQNFGAYLQNPDNVLIKDMIRAAEQNPDSGLKIIRGGPKNNVVAIQEGNKIYHAVGSNRKPVEGAPKNSISIVKHPAFKKRADFVKKQKAFKNTKIKNSNLTYGKALDILESKKANIPLQNKNPAEFEHVKGVATDYKKGQIALRTANREKQAILAALKNKNITKAEADKALKKIGVRAFVDGRYIGAPSIDVDKQFNDLKKYVDRKILSDSDVMKALDIEDLTKIEGVTTASKIKRPEKALTKELFDNAFKENDKVKPFKHHDRDSFLSTKRQHNALVKAEAVSTKTFGKAAEQIKDLDIPKGTLLKASAKGILRAISPFIPFVGAVGVGLGAADVAKAAERGLENEELGIAYLLGPELAQKYSDIKDRGFSFDKTTDYDDPSA